MKTLILNDRGDLNKKDLTRSSFSALFDDLNIRDLRPVLSPFQVSTILPRDNVIIINMGAFKCVLTETTAYFIVHRHDQRVTVIITRLAEKHATHAENTFVLSVLETLFDEKLVQIKEKIAHIDHKAEITLTRIRKNFSEQDLENLLAIKKRLSKMSTRNKEILSAAEEALDDNEDFEQIIALSGKTEDARDELASIFENFIEQMEDVTSAVFRLGEDIEDTEEYVHLKLNARRTTIIRADLLATLFTLILSFLAVIVGLYGVNIRNGFEESPQAFYTLAVILVLLLFTGIIGTFFYLKKKHLF